MTAFRRAFTSCALLVACSRGEPPSPATSTNAAPAVDASASVAFPTLEPFRNSAWWPMIAGKPISRVDLRQLDEARRKMSQMERSERAPGPSDLAPVVPRARRMWWGFVPPIVSQFAPLWERRTWTAQERTTATCAAEFLAQDEEGVRLDFGTADADHDHAEVARLAAWFRAAAARPEIYAAMVFTLDDGPFQGLPAPKGATFEPKAAVDLRVGTKIELGRFGDADWALRCRRATDVVWERVLAHGRGSDDPDGSIQFSSERPVEAVGPYGSVVHLFVDGEHAPVYLGADDRLLFFFVSW